VPGPPGAKSAEFERCEVCMPGYYLTSSGGCRMSSMWIFLVIAVVAFILICIGITWYVKLWKRPIVNQHGLDFALGCRRHSILLQAESGEPYPLTTNMLSTNVAGAGTTCLFRFQFALIVWAAGLLAIWMGLAYFVSSDLLILGNRDASTPQLLCAAIAWGHQRQNELLWAKVLWCLLAYVFSVVGALIYAYYQTKFFTTVDSENTTCADFAAVLRGLPSFDGSKDMEAEIKEAVQEATDHDVYDVSIAWNFHGHEDVILAAVEKDVYPEDSSPDSIASPPAQRGLLDRSLSRVNRTIFGIEDVQAEETADEESQDEDAEMGERLRSLKSTDTAFVIFNSEVGRDSAVEFVKNRGGHITVCGKECSLQICQREPREVNWENFAVTKSERFNYSMKGILAVLGGCFAWTVLLYLPYAYYVASFSYANGDEPGILSSSIFCALVVGSQIGLFCVSKFAAECSCFLYQDQMHWWYTLLYNTALILNFILDMILQAYLSYLQMVGVGAHTADGKKLGHLTVVQEIFESYPMQKSLGNLLFVYCWPCTFLVPFLFEPLMAIWFPKHIGSLFVRSTQNLQRSQAAKALQMAEMEQVRYADIIFNVCCIACVPFMAPAYLHLSLIVLILSHVYIYLYDQVKVLRYVSSFTCSSASIHNLGQQLFAIPISVLVGAMVFKASQLTTSFGGTDAGTLLGRRVWLLTGSAMLFHALFHWVALKVIFSYCQGQVDRSMSKQSYAALERREKATYLSLNPVHCLRCRYGLIGEGPVVSYWSAFKM